MTGNSESSWRQTAQKSWPLIVCAAFLVLGISVTQFETRRRRQHSTSRQQPAQVLEQQQDPLAVNDDDEQLGVVLELWRAALSGDHLEVRRLLQENDIHPGTLHPLTQSQLVLDIAAIDVDNDQLPQHASLPRLWTAGLPAHGVDAPVLALLPTDRDELLRRVLKVLASQGWSMSVRDPATGENALHILASQPDQHLVAERSRFLVRRARSHHPGMLVARTAAGQLPEDLVPRSEGACEARLRMARVHISRARAARVDAAVPGTE